MGLFITCLYRYLMCFLFFFFGIHFLLVGKKVLDERVVHIAYVPSTPEPYYHFTGHEIQPRPVGEENGAVVFYYNPISAVNYVSVVFDSLFFIFIFIKYHLFWCIL